MSEKGSVAVESGGTGVHLKVEYPDVQSFLNDYRKNIRKGTTFVTSHRKWTVGDRLRITLSFPGLLEPVELPGRVSWARIGKDSGVGVEFPFDDQPQLKDRLDRIAQAVERGDPQVIARIVKLLMVEDNAIICDMLQEGLNQRASRCDPVPVVFQFFRAPDGVSALKIIEENPIDALIVDLYLPVLGGDSLIKTCRKLFGAHIPIVAISGGGRGAEELAMKAGADIFLKKPLRLVNVFAAMTQLLGIDLTDSL